jgi:hypothetical protein
METVTVPPRMHFPWAQDVARLGYAIRRAGWTSLWWRYTGGLWYVIGDGDARVARTHDRTLASARPWSSGSM